MSIKILAVNFENIYITTISFKIHSFLTTTSLKNAPEGYNNKEWNFGKNKEIPNWLGIVSYRILG